MIDANDYKMLLKHYTAEKEKIAEEIKAQQDELRKKRMVLEQYNEILNRFSSAVEKQKIDSSLVNELIEQITVGNDNRIEIDLKIKDQLEEGIKIIGGSTV